MQWNVWNLSPWLRYIDDTITAVKPSALNNYDSNIQFTYEVEASNKSLPFLVQLLRNQQHIETTVYRKPTANDIYLHWDSFTPKKWRIGTLKTHAKQRKAELQHISNVFSTVNGYPKWIIDNLKEKIQNGILSEQMEDKTTTSSILVFTIQRP